MWPRVGYSRILVLVLYVDEHTRRELRTSRRSSERKFEYSYPYVRVQQASAPCPRAGGRPHLPWSSVLARPRQPAVQFSV